MNQESPSEDKYNFQIKPYTKPTNHNQQHAVDEKILRMPFNSNNSKTVINLLKNINIEEANKSRIMELQDELIRTRKEIYLKECHFAKQKNNLLNKIQLLSMENTQIKQRQNNLAQINHTLTLALENKNYNADRLEKRDEEKLKELQSQNTKKDKLIQEQKKMIQQYKCNYQNVNHATQAKLQEKDYKINDLTRRNRQIQQEYEHKIEKIKQTLTSLSVNKHLLQSIFETVSTQYNPYDRSFDINMRESQQFDISQVNDESFPQITQQSQNYSKNSQSKSGKKVIKINRYQNNNFRHSNAKSNANSSIISKHSLSFIQSKPSNEYMFSQQSESGFLQCQTEKYLCEICNKVYNEYEFREHMRHCQQVEDLHREKRRLEQTISQIEVQERHSISQKKPIPKYNTSNKRLGDMNKLKRIQLSDIMNEDWKRNENMHKVKKKNANYSKQSIEQLNKIMSDLTRAQTNRSKQQQQNKVINTNRYTKGSNYY